MRLTKWIDGWARVETSTGDGNWRLVADLFCDAIEIGFGSADVVWNVGSVEVGVA